jgi:hypothetical protein
LKKVIPVNMDRSRVVKENDPKEAYGNLDRNNTNSTPQRERKNNQLETITGF